MPENLLCKLLVSELCCKIKQCSSSSAPRRGCMVCDLTEQVFDLSHQPYVASALAELVNCTQGSRWCLV